MSRRRMLLAASVASGGTEYIFPIHINLVKISSDEYRADPTPESIALCDYFKKNAVFDGSAGWELNLNPGELYIDGIEVQNLSCMGTAGKDFDPSGAWWYPYHNRYDSFSGLFFSIYFADNLYPKGTFAVFNDN